MGLINRTRAPASDDVTSVRKISTLDHCQGRKQWETQGPGRADGVNISKVRPN